MSNFRGYLNASCVAALIAGIAVAPVAAQETESGERQSRARIDEILVSARKVEESMQKTPVAVTAFSGDDLVNDSVVQISDLQYKTSSLTFGPAIINPSAIYLSMRGQVVIDARLQNDNAIGIYVDGAYIPRNVGLQVSDLVDVQSVEVLKGPQGTLYGRNTTGGAIKIFNKSPTDEFEGMARFRAGNYGQIDFAGMVNVPLGDSLALRVIGERHDREGYGTDLISGGDLGAREGYSLRGALEWNAATNLTVTLRGSYGENEETSPAWRLIDMQVGTGGNALVTAMSGLNPTVLANLVAGRDIFLNQQSADFQDASFSTPSLEDINVWSFSGTINWEISDKFTLSSITSGWGFDRFGSIDLDGSRFPILDLNSFAMDDEQFSEELQLTSKLFDDRVTVITGFYYSDEQGFEFNEQTALGFLNPTNPGIIDADVHNEAIGAYMHADVAITDRLSVFGGIRYSEDDRSITARNRNAVFCTTLGITFANLGAAPCERFISDEFDNTSYTGGVNFELTPDVMVYAKTSRGYRSGVVPINGGGTTPASAAATFASVFPEVVTDYEAGLKSDLFEGRIRANLTYYHSDYDNIQRTGLGVVPGTSQIVNLLTNAAKGKIDGVELELTWVPMEGLEFFGTGAYTNARFTEFTDPVTMVDLTDTPFQFTPEFSFSLSAAHTAEFSFGAIRTQVDYAWSDELYGTVPNGLRESLGLLNARINLHLEESAFDIAVFGKNLTDEEYFASPLDLTKSSIGFQSSPVGAPRTWGVEITKTF